MTATYLSAGRGESLNSLRAKSNHRYPRTLAAAHLGLSVAAFDAGCRAADYSATEWHHTGKYANATTFYDCEELAANSDFWAGAAAAYKSTARRQELLGAARERKRESFRAEIRANMRRAMVRPANQHCGCRYRRANELTAAFEVRLTDEFGPMNYDLTESSTGSTIVRWIEALKRETRPLSQLVADELYESVTQPCRAAKAEAAAWETTKATMAAAGWSGQRNKKGNFVFRRAGITLARDRFATNANVAWKAWLVGNVIAVAATAEDLVNVKTEGKR